MQKIFIVTQEPGNQDENGNLSRVNEFIRDGGHIISVSAQDVAMGGQSPSSQRGRWLVVADDGKPKKGEDLLP